MKIEVDLRCDVRVKFFTQAKVKRAARRLLVLLGWKKASVGLWLVHDRKIRALNRRFLGHDRPTDVIAFPSQGTSFLGDVVISTDTVRRQAWELGHGPGYELLFCLAHGILHLMGYDDKTKKDRNRMFHKQKALLKCL